MYLSCSSDLSPPQLSSSSGDLLPEMMESEMPPPATPPYKAGDPEVSSRRASPDPARPEGNPMATRSPQYPALEESNQKSPASSGARSDVWRDLLEKVAISVEHRILMGTMIERISSGESGLHEAFVSLLAGSKVREMMYIFQSTAHV